MTSVPRRCFSALFLGGVLTAAVALWPGSDLGAEELASGSPNQDAGVLARPVTLRKSIVVDDDMIRLGDLFEMTGEASEMPIAHAPEPGRRIVFDAAWLWRAARTHRLDWRPLSRRERVVVEREAVEVPAAHLEALLLDSLADRGVDTDSISLRFAAKSTHVFLSPHPDANLVVDDISHDPGRDRFTATVRTTAPNAADRRIRLTGWIDTMADVPVLARRVSIGDVITQADLDWRQMPSRRLNRSIVVDAGRLLGKTPRRPLRQGAPIRANDLREPSIVAKGDQVTIILAAPHMMLTARGRALEDGGRGAVIRVTNLQSRTVVDATVIGSGRVEIVPNSAAALAGRTQAREFRQ